METEIAIHSHGLPFEFPREPVLAEAEAYGAQHPAGCASQGARICASCRSSRSTARTRATSTMRSTARPSSGGCRLIVAIADVGHYVRPGTALDAEARNRGTSVYFPNRVLPMLPEALSNGLCSLKPKVDRLCMVLRMRVSDDGRVTRDALLRGRDALGRAAHLHARSRRIPRAAATRGTTARLAAAARAPARAARRLPCAHDARAPVAARSSSRRPSSSSSSMRDGRIAAIVEQPRNDAHRLIEECMIAANVAAARFLDRTHADAVPRARPARATGSRRCDSSCASSASGCRRPRRARPSTCASCCSRSATDRMRHLIQTAVIRSMPQAVYQPGEHRSLRPGARGLRALHLADPALSGPGGASRDPPGAARRDESADLLTWHGAVAALGQDCSFRERRADEATRARCRWLKC